MLGRRAGDPREGARTPVALNEYASRARHLCLPLSSPLHRLESTYGVACMPSNSTGMNADPAVLSGSTGWYCAAILTLTVRWRVSGSGLITSMTHSGSPVALSDCWMTRSPLDRSKSRTFSTSRERAAGEHCPELHRERT
jgi:hypothetical protein